MPNLPIQPRQAESVQSYVQQDAPTPPKNLLSTRRFFLFLGAIVFFGLIVSLLILNYLGTVKLSNYLSFLSFLPTREVRKEEPAFALSINGVETSQDEFNELVSYIKQVRATTDDVLAKTSAVQTLEERSILQAEAKTRGLSVDEAEVKRLLFSSTTSAALEGGYPDYERSIRDRLLREKIEPLIIGKRTGRYIFVGFGFDRPEMGSIDQRALAEAKIKGAMVRIRAGEDMTAVGTSLDADSDVTALNHGVALLTFTDQERGTILFSEELTNTVFNLKVGTVSDIVVVKNDPAKWGRRPGHEEFGFAIATVDSMTPGSFPSYADWLSSEQKKLVMVSNIP